MTRALLLCPEPLGHGQPAGVGIRFLEMAQGHAANDLFAHGNAIPTVVDLYDPFIIENLNYYETRGAEVFTHDHATLMRSLLRGDLFLCASSAQRLFYLGALMAAGRVN